MDKLSAQQRHNNMAAIRSKDTKPEMIVRRGLWSRGFRYRLNHKRLPGHPDLVLRKYRTCIFVNGCFWHGHHINLQFDNLQFTIYNSECCKIPKTNREFWVAKIRRNKERDKEEQRRLAEMGWHCITVWECELKPSKREETLESIAFTLNHIWLQDHRSLTPRSAEGRLQGKNPIPDVPSPTRSLSPRGEGNFYGEGSNYQLTEEGDMQMPMAAEEAITNK